MFKFRRLLCVVLVCALVGVAYGAAKKIRSFVPTSSELSTAYGTPDGMAILNYVAGNNKTITQIVLNGFTPNTSYDVWFDSLNVGPGCGFGLLVTDENGDGHVHLVDFGLDTSDTNIYLYVNLNCSNVNVPTGDLRAVGHQ